MQYIVVASALMLSTILSATYSFAACGSFPGGVGSNDRVVSFLVNGGKFADVKSSSAGSPSEGMLIYDSNENALKFCNGSDWMTLETNEATSDPSGSVAYGWGNTDESAIGNLAFVNGTLESPTRMDYSGDLSNLTWNFVAAGSQTYCGITPPSQKMYCWGFSPGYGVTAGSARPVELTTTGGLNNAAWKTVSPGTNGACAIRLSDDRMFCWGVNNYGQLGQGNTTPNYTPSELTTTGGWNTTAWKSVSQSETHTCGIRQSDNRIFCWGDNWYGQLGTGNNTESYVPVGLTATGGWSTTEWKSVHAGSNFTCAIRLSDNLVFCWGDSNVGQLGNETWTFSTTPVSLTATGGWNAVAWKSISVGYRHTCGIRLSDDLMYCWGYNNSGQLGVNDTTNRNVPTALTGAWATTGWEAAGANYNHTCAIRLSDKYLYCWGQGLSGELGTGGTSNSSAPTALTSNGGFNTTAWSAVSGGNGRGTCAIRQDDGKMYCWGMGPGPVANGSYGNVLEPTLHYSGDTEVWSSMEWKELAAGGRGACGIAKATNYIHCWGYNSYAEHGNGTTTRTYKISSLDSAGGWNTTQWKTLSRGKGQHGAYHVCAIRLSDDRLFCWGGNFGNYGVLGTGANGGANYPVPLTSTGGWDTTAWKSVAAGDNHTCAIRLSDDRLFCWGRNNVGQLGRGNTTNSNVPVALTSTGGFDTTAWKSVTAGGSHTCAIRLSDNVLYCWGSNNTGQLGTGNTTNSSSPIALTATGGWNTTAWKSVSAGGGTISHQSHTCAIRLSDDRLFCWGYNGNGQIGDGTITDRTAPTALNATGGYNTMTWSSLSSGAYHTCAIRLTDSRLLCWGGASSYATLGRGPGGSHSSSTPGELDPVNGFDKMTWESVSAGFIHTMAVSGGASYERSSGPHSALRGQDHLKGFQSSGVLKASTVLRLSSGSVAEGYLGFSHSKNLLYFSDGTHWRSIKTGAASGSCSTYPSDGIDSRVIEFADATSNPPRTSSRTARATPRKGSVIYNASAKALQLCDGTNWRSLNYNKSYLSPGSFSYVVPAGVTSVTFRAWGGGGGGGNQTAQANGGGGGGFTVKAVSVTPGETLTVVVGAGGASGANGSATELRRGGTTLAQATGGLTAGGASPTPTAGTYDTFYPGGAGAAAQGGGGSRAGSGGGGGAGSGASGAAGTAGASGTPGVGGAGGAPDGGAGGGGGAAGASGTNGTFPGGGGGGSGSSNTTSGTGGGGMAKVVPSI